MQVNAFAAPRTEGIWAEVLDEIADVAHRRRRHRETRRGAYGPELHAQRADPGPGRRHRHGARPLRRGRRPALVPARAAHRAGRDRRRAVAAPLEAALRDVVVVRGTDPMAVRDPLPLRLPAEALARAGRRARSDADEDEDGDPLRLAERGPEITEIR